MATLPDDPPFDVREQLARIDRMRAETLKLQEELQKVVAETLKANRDAIKVQVDTMKVEQDLRLQPWTIVITAVGAGAALMGAALALAKLFLS